MEDGAIGIVDDAPVAGDDYQWYPVTFGTGDAAVTGYVAGDFLSGGITIGSAAEVADGPLNLRADPSTDTDPIGQLETGASVTIVAGPTDDAAGTHWFEVTSGDLSGYVAGQYFGAPSA